MGAEINFEVLAAILEDARGTAQAAPARYLNMIGTLTPEQTEHAEAFTDGLLAERRRTTVVRQMGKYSASGAVDLNNLHWWMNLAVRGGVFSPYTPDGAVLTRLWEFAPNLTADDLLSATLFCGDPNVAVWQGAFAMLDKVEINADGTGTNLTDLKIEGMTQFPVDLASAPALPAQAVGPAVVPGRMQIWADLATADIGTTELIGRCLHVTHTIPTGVTYKYPPTGPVGALNYTQIGRKKRHITTKIIFELADLDQYAQWKAKRLLKVRVRHNGPVIETVGLVDFFSYLEVDTFGTWNALAWGAYEGTNRTIELTVESQYNEDEGTDFAVRVQNNQTTVE